MTAFEDFVSAELPRRRTLLKSSDGDVSFDGDPNDPSAPAIIQGSPLGTWYHRASNDIFYKRHLNRWRPEDEVSTFDIYVNPTTGDDNAVGDSTRPIATLKELAARSPIFAKGANVFLSAGQHKIADNSATGVVDALIQQYPRPNLRTTLTVQGSTSTYATVNATSVLNNVMNVSDTLTPGEMVGKYILATSGATLREKWVRSNDASSITFNSTPSAWGGNTTLPTGSVDVLQLDTRITPPDTNQTNGANRFYYFGGIAFTLIDFDGPGQSFGVLGMANDSSIAEFNAVRIQNWNTGLIAPNALVRNCYFQDCLATGALLGGLSTLAADNAFVDCRYCIGQGSPGLAADRGTLQTSSICAFWVDSCRAVFGTTIHDITDLSSGYWVDDTSGTWPPEAYISVRNVGGNYQKQLRPFVKRGGTVDWPVILDTIQGAANFDFQDTDNASIGATPNFFTDGTNTITLPNFIAGSPPASAAYHLSTPRGTFVFDGDEAAAPA